MGPVVSIPSRFRGRARRDAAAFYLSQLAQGLLAGELGILTGHETLVVQPADLLVLEIVFTQKSRVSHLSVRVRWPRRSGGSGAPAGRRRARDLPRQPRGEGHPEFTLPSSGRNPETRDSPTDADHR